MFFGTEGRCCGKQACASVKNKIDTFYIWKYNSAKNKNGTLGERSMMTLEEAMKRIEELENENYKLRSENERLRKRKVPGRKKHDEAWAGAYKEFVAQYESGMTIVEIVERGGISRRTAYRYKAYYEQLMKNS